MTPPPWWSSYYNITAEARVPGIFPSFANLRCRSTVVPTLIYAMSAPTYHTLVRCIEVYRHGDLDESPSPWFGWDHPLLWDHTYNQRFELNCAQKYNELRLPGLKGLDLCLVDYPIHPHSDAVAFTNSCSTELEYQEYLIVFESPSGKTITRRISTNR